jgi:uncharacterized protein (DUF1800 family)
VEEHGRTIPALTSALMDQKQLQHLYLRAGFGETPQTIQSLLRTSREDVVEGLFVSSREYKNISYLPYPLNEGQYNKGVNVFQLVGMILRSKAEMEELNGEWLFKMTYTKAVLREKMTLFWHNHFATSAPFAYLMQVQNNTLRKHALGKFSDLLHAISKDPAMIVYLNNQENKKNHPNENFAREVMELFSLGEGHYTEKDIKEAARAFTGWTVNLKGEFEFNKAEHDDGEKTVFGKKGNFNGEEVIAMLLENRQTARYVVNKIYREFVNPTVDAARAEELADGFYRSGYDIGGLMKKIFLSDWFYDPKNVGVKITSPVELLVRYKKLVSLEFKKPKDLIGLQQVLGQILFFPPNVAGWKGGTAWIDSTSLLLRLNLPGHAINGTAPNVEAKPAFEEKSGGEGTRQEGKGAVTADWSGLEEFFKNVPPEALTEQMIGHLIQCDPGKINRSLVQSGTQGQTLRHRCAYLMSLPEFQLI